MNHFTKWCQSNHVDIRVPPIESIANFLLYLFQGRKLQPSSIVGYRSAIADKMENSPINVSKDENLTHLLDSFHRDRSKGRRGIPSWKLFLVLHKITKAPSELIEEALLKHLTFKTVFLLVLGSGKRRSIIHAWQNKNIRHQSDWSKVSLYPLLLGLNSYLFCPSSKRGGVISVCCSNQEGSTMCHLGNAEYNTGPASGNTG